MANIINKKYVGIDNLYYPETLPVISEDVKVKYEGSIDKAGGNDDWDWWLYQDENKEWVIFDVDGPGCIYNFVQHRYPVSEEPTFKFYFDNEKTPRFIIKHSEFGEIYPFIEPLASRYIGPVDEGRGPIRVIRSFVPMPFVKGCKITSSVKLEGYSKSELGGGWGHVIYHSYSSVPDGLSTFSVKDDYYGLIKKYKNIGVDPKELYEDDQVVNISDITIASGQTYKIFEDIGYGAITAFQLRMNKNEVDMKNLWIEMIWDDHVNPDINLPLSCFFSNELQYNKTEYLMAGFEPQGISYNYFPMPFWEKARIVLVNKSDKTIEIPWIGIRKSDTDFYKKTECGYFKASYYARKATPGSDSIIADIKGRGQVVSELITAFGDKPNTITCEGDVRVYIDECLTPQVESDGSESHSCYGWGFPTPPETNPFSGYDGLPDNPWSMTRQCIGDWYPFNSRLKFGIESGPCNDQYLEHSGTIFYYAKDEVSAELTDELDVGNQQSREAHSFSSIGNMIEEELESFYEGDDDHIQFKDTGFYEFDETTFFVSIDKKNKGVIIRRRSDQNNCQQCAKVWIDDELINEREWYYADRNTIKRWLDDEFAIPVKYTKNKSMLKVRIVPQKITKEQSWNEYHFWIYSIIN